MMKFHALFILRDSSGKDKCPLALFPDIMQKLWLLVILLKQYLCTPVILKMKLIKMTVYIPIKG